MTMPSTLKQAIEQKEAERVASNLSNLAQARVHFVERRQSILEALTEIDAAIGEVDDFAVRDPASITAEEVKRIYHRSTNYGSQRI